MINRMHTKMFCSVVLISLALLIQSRTANGSEQPNPPTAASPFPSLLVTVQQQIQTTLEEVDKKLAAVAKELVGTGPAHPGVRAVLGRICPNPAQPYLIDCCTVDPKGKILAVEPQDFKGSEGADISGQEQIVRLHCTKQPVMSRALAMVEGFDAVDLEQPILSQSGELLGSVSVLINPETFLASVITPAIQGFPVQIVVMEKDGRILYDADEGEIGKNLFQDALYKPFKELQDLGRRIAKEPSGSGSYAFYEEGSEKTVVTKRATWNTIGIHGTEWRLVMIQKATEDLVSKIGTIDPSGVPELIGKLCANAELQNALALGDEAKALSIFKKFTEEKPGLYSVQWLDVSGTNRFGYPPENSLRDYHLQESRSPGDNLFKAALADRKESAFELPLEEGGMGTFYLHPIYSGENYLGMLYVILKKEAKAP